jgi:hypothetical protein
MSDLKPLLNQASLRKFPSTKSLLQLRSLGLLTWGTFAGLKGIVKSAGETFMKLATILAQGLQSFCVRMRFNSTPNEHASSSDAHADWVMEGCQQLIARTVPRPEPDDNTHAFRALVWMLNNSNDKEKIKQVLEHIAKFPEVLLDSRASTHLLHNTVAKTTQHLGQFQHDRLDSRDTSYFNALCAKLAYLAYRPWLHPFREENLLYTTIEARLLEMSNL